jgi:GWxTD domain-containing protein
VITLKEFPTDAYTLVISLIDTALNKGVASSKKFYLFNPGVKDSLIGIDVFAGYIGSEFGVFSETECDELFDKSKYISTSSEITQYERLDSLNSKREFLYEFWKRRDTDPTTELNEFKEEYKNRLEFVKVRFKAFNKPGYKTDRGRIYLTYGEPDQVDRYPNETNMKPYEIWYYNSIEGGVVFIFGDLTGFSDYELLSSTKRGEMQDDSWTRRLITN